MKIRLSLPIILLISLASCRVSDPMANGAAAEQNIEPDYSSPHPGTYSIMWHQNSGEYKALCRQAFYIAKQRLLESTEGSDSINTNPAIIVDVDETLLDNSPYFARLAIENTSFSDESWKEWTDKHAAEFVPGALEFLHLAKDLRIPVFFISNRSMNEVESTMENLNDMGYEVKSPAHFLFKNEDRSKVERRKKVASEYDIILLVGDNLLDFSHAFAGYSDQPASTDSTTKHLMNLFGEKFIILPNSMYGEWLYNKNDRKMAGDELNRKAIKFRKSKIRSF